MSVIREPRLYGGWAKPQLQGIAGLSLGVSVLLLVTAPVVVLAFSFGNRWLAAGLAFAVVVTAAGLTLRGPVSQRTVLELVGIRLRKRWLIRAKGAVLAQGAVGLTPDGLCRLPGLMAASEMWQHHDGYGQPFGVIRVPSVGHWTVAIECAASGLDMRDDDSIDRQVASWGGWLAHLGQDHTDVVGAQAVIETSPDPGVRLQQSIDRRAAAQYPVFAGEVMDQIANAYPAGQSKISTRITVTFNEKLPGSPEKRSPEQMLVRIANALPSLLAGLAVSGGGQAPRAMRPADLTDALRVSFDPVVAEDVERAREEPEGTGLSWHDAGPSFMDDRHPGWLEHDRAVSVSWQMTVPPRNNVNHNILRRLLSPHPAVALKRVSLLYRPLDLEASARIADRQVTNATFALNNTRRIQARDQLRFDQARQTAEEEARGASLVMFGLVATATVLHQSDIPAAEAAMRELSASARVRLRPATRLQAAVFTAGLPVGLVLPAHVSVPPMLQEAV